MLADWLELEALCSKTASASVHAINSDDLSEPDAQPDDDLDEDGVRDEERVARLTLEVQSRGSTLGTSYPFRMTDDGSRLECTTSGGVGGTVYLFCLVASHARAGGLLHQSNVVDLKEVPNLLQACATWSAAGYEEGPAYAFGLDPHSSGFLPKLAQIYAALGDGTPLTSIPPGAPKYVKDDGVDVIAWKSTPHPLPPASYLLAQVASGKNWDGKSLKHLIAQFHATWFSPGPATEGKPAIMIPFCIEGIDDEDEDLAQEALRMQWRRHVSKFGELFYRYTLPHYANLGLQLSTTRGIHVDMIDWLSRLQDFVAAVIAKLQSQGGG